MIHEDSSSLIDLMIFSVFLWCSNFCLIQTQYHHSFCPTRYGVFCNCIKHQIILETSRLSARNAWVIQGVRGMLPPEDFWKFDPRKRHILHSLDRTQLIHTCILLSFSQSLVTHHEWFPSRSTKIHDSQVFKQKFVILTCFVTRIHDSWFRFHPRSYWKVDEYLPLKSEKIYICSYPQYIVQLCSTFRSPSAVRRPRLSKIILINPTFRPHLFCELSIDIISLQTFLRKKIYCFKFATKDYEEDVQVWKPDHCPPSCLHYESPNM